MGVSVGGTATREQTDDRNLDNANKNKGDLNTLGDQYQKERVDTFQDE